MYLERDYLTGSSLALPIKKVLYKKQSPYQLIEIFDTGESFGKVLTLDGISQLSERDEFSYHEMLVHVPMHAHPSPKNILVIGGGDGAAIRELVKYPSIESITFCEIDHMVVDACKQFFPEITTGFSDPRVETHFVDATFFVKNEPDESYDIILVD